MKGDHFELIRTPDGKYRWELWGGYHPTGPIARSGRDYSSAQNARNSMRSARTSMIGAVDQDDKIRVSVRKQE